MDEILILEGSNGPTWVSALAPSSQGIKDFFFRFEKAISDRKKIFNFHLGLKNCFGRIMKQALFGMCSSSNNNILFVTAYVPNYQTKIYKVKVPNNSG